jgi:tRNA-specific adenosine deaminase 3
MYHIETTPEFGRGLYASRGIIANTVIEIAELLVLSPDDTIKINQTDLKYYTFVFNETQDCLVLGNGEIFNHADRPNVRFALIEKNGRKIMQFIANRCIATGEQLFIDYTADTKVDTKSYNKNLIA